MAVRGHTHNSSFAYKGRAVDVKQVGRELGVRYVLEGGVRRSAEPGAHHCATFQNVDRGATLGGPLRGHARGHLRSTGSDDGWLWLNSIAPKLEPAEIEGPKYQRTQSPDAYDYYLRGIANLNRGTGEASNEALELFLQGYQARP